MTQLVTHTHTYEHTPSHSGALRMKDEKANCKNDISDFFTISPPLFSHIYLETDYTHFTATDTTLLVMTT